jgi:hypothetical protein
MAKLLCTRQMQEKRKGWGCGGETQIWMEKRERNCNLLVEIVFIRSASAFQLMRLPVYKQNILLAAAHKQNICWTVTTHAWVACGSRYWPRRFPFPREKVIQRKISSNLFFFSWTSFF